MSSPIAAAVVNPPADRAKKPFPLRDHQSDAIAAVQADLDRQQVIMACGTGKTVTGQHATHTLLQGRTGTVLILTPTLTLLQQTFESWAAHAPFGFQAIAVCSRLDRSTDDIDMSELTLSATTDPAVLAGFIAAAPDSIRAVFATYQSLGVVIDAHTQHGIPQWDVALCDEAHRTAGSADKAFARVLYDKFVPAEHRLFMTATPKVHTVSAGARTEIVLASMDDQYLYGKQVYSLSVAEAVEAGILSKYQVAVIGVLDSELDAAAAAIDRTGDAETRMSLDHIAGVVALSKAARERDLRSVIAFFNTIRASKAFVGAFNAVHSALNGGAAEHIDGSMKLNHRREALNRLASDRGGGLYLISNARCLSEGIDVPVLDAVLFGEKRTSQVDVVQCVGRAIRKNPRTDAPALIVLAVRIGAGDDPEAAIEESEFMKVRQVIAALGDHDPRIAEEMKLLVRGGGVGNRDDGEPAEPPLWMDIPEHLLENGFALRLLDIGGRGFEAGLAAVRVYTARHGHARVPSTYESANGHRTGQWVSNARTKYRTGQLAAEEIAELESIPGWVWKVKVVDEKDSRCGLSEVRAYVAEHGHARVTTSYVASNGYRTGLWVANARTKYRTGQLTAGEIADLESLPGWVWRPREEQWAAGVAAVRDYAAEYGHGQVPHGYVAPDGYRTSNWVSQARIRYHRGKLTAEKISELESIPGWVWGVRKGWVWRTC
jgi:superfamily II DNA or RNA helicase